jgi:hypothetical protein
MGGRCEMSRDTDLVLRYRNYAEELRIIAADKTTTKVRASLLGAAEIFDHMAQSAERIDISRRAAGFPPNSN